MTCRNGHDAERRVCSDGYTRCVQCMKESNKARVARYYAKHKDAKRERDRQRALAARLGW